MSHFKSLGLTSSATSTEIKAAYRKLALKYHPDKSPDHKEEFQAIQVAWEILRDEVTRKEYENELFQAEGPSAVSYELSMDELTKESDELYFYPCRCGDRFEVTQEDLDDGYEVFNCPSCSLNIRVLLSDQEESSDEEWDEDEDESEARKNKNKDRGEKQAR